MSAKLEPRALEAVPFLSFPFLSFPFLSFPFLSFEVRTMASASTDVVATTSLVLAFTNTCGGAHAQAG